MKERIKGAFTKKKIFHFLKMALFVVALSLILLSLLGTVAHATGLVDDTINAENLYSKYPLSNYQLDFYVDNSWSWLPWNWLDGIGKSVQYGLYCITNFVWTISLYLSNATGYVVQEAYKLDFINDMADSIGKSIQTLAGVTQNGFSSTGFYIGFLLLIILVVGLYVAYTGLIKRETSKALHAVINFVVVFVLSASFIAYAPDYIKKINEFSSDISTASLDLGTKIMLPNSDSEGKDSVDLIRDSLFSIQVEQPWLLLQFGNSNAEEIGTDRVEALVSASPEDEDGKTREEVVKTEIEDNDNNNLTIPQVVNRLGMVFFLLFFNLGITIFVFLLTGMMLFSQILFIIFAMFLPISFLLSMIPSYESMAKQAIVRVFNTIMTRAGITLIVTVLLENKISRRFKVRRLEINDFGYLMEHLYGRDGIAYEDYEYQLPKKELKKETLIKYYDLIRPTRCVIEECQRYLRLEHEDKESYVSYFTVNAIVGELDFPSSEIFYFQQQQFTFPVDTSMNVEIVENRKALTTVRNKKKELKDLDNHAYQAGSETSSNVVDALDSVDELETDLDQSKESMYKLSYVIRVSAPDLDELKRRCDEVKDFYDDLNVKLVRPAGDMLGLHSEFLPASKRYINDYVQYVKSDFLAGLGFGATQQLGENTGIYMGYSVDTGRNVYLQPSLASQGVKGTVTNALASAFVGSLGGGKSFCNNLLVYYSVLFGGQAVILDPKSERGNWKETLPEIAHEINIVNLTSDKDNAGLLDPFVIMKNVKDAESLAIDILTFLTGISSRDGEKFPVLRKAVRSVTQSEKGGLLHVIEELRKEDTPVSRNIADHIDSFTDYDFAHLLFSDGTVENAISLDNQLNIIQVADLVLPDKDTTFEEYTTIELLSVSMLIVISTFALDFIHSDRSIFKIVDLDEAWAFLNVAQGETLSNKLVRAGRAMQAGVYFVTQSAYDVSKESLKNNIGLKFAFRSTDLGEIKQTLEFFGIDKDDENNQKRLRDLENGQCLLQDLYGRVGVVQIHPVFEELLHAFDTRPPVQRNEVE